MSGRTCFKCQFHINLTCSLCSWPLQNGAPPYGGCPLDKVEAAGWLPPNPERQTTGGKATPDLLAQFTWEALCILQNHEGKPCRITIEPLPEVKTDATLDT
jgi:hypothetical protein